MPLTSRQADRKQSNKMRKRKGTGPGFLGGYMGLTNTALEISWYVPKCKTYVEPFAGLGRVAKYVKAEKLHLNDKSDFACNYLRKHFTDAVITSHDFEKMFVLDDIKTVFLIDPPWTRKEYVHGCNENAFCDRSAVQYYDDIIKWLPKLRGIWFVCGKKGNKKLLDPRYHNRLFVSRKKFMGNNFTTLVMSNKPFAMHMQKNLRDD